jgi:hypothetical protein
MSPNPASFQEHIKEKGYHSRSNKHSNALAEAIVNDLFNYCPIIKKKATLGEIVYDVNFDIFGGNDKWNVDLVLGRPPPGIIDNNKDYIIKTAPASVEIAIELKAVMTEHHKAIKNRKRDLEAHHAHVHRYKQSTIAGGVFILNCSETFQSPLRENVTVHRKPLDLINHCMNEMRSIESSGGMLGKPGLDARAVVCVNCDNVKLVDTCYLTSKPAPQTGDPLHYDSFIQTICNLYMDRFR